MADSVRKQAARRQGDATGCKPRAAPQTPPGAASALRPGHTLLELTLVVAIVGILSAIAIPRYGSYVGRQRVDAAARRVVLDLSLARNRARITSTGVTVSFDPVTNRYQILGMTDSDRKIATYGVRLSDDPYGVDLVSADFGGDSEVIFTGYGDPDSGGTVVLSAHDYAVTVTLDADSGLASVP
jgi:type II secretion system protein H